MKFFRQILLTICFLLLSSGGLEAQNVFRALLSLHSEKKPVQALGLLISTQGTLQKTDVDIQSLGNNRYRLAFVYAASEVRPDTSATAMVSFEDGSIDFVRSTALRNNSLRAPLVDLPFCEETPSSVSQRAPEVGLLQSLVEVREKRIQQSSLKIRQEMSGPFLARLQKLEKAFGLESDPPISPDLPIEQLVSRLYRISAVAKTFEVSRSQAQ